MASRRENPPEAGTSSDEVSSIGDSPLAPLRAFIPTHQDDLKGMHVMDNTMLDQRSSRESDSSVSYPSHEPSMLEELRAAVGGGLPGIRAMMNPKKAPRFTIDFSLSNSRDSMNSSGNLSPIEKRSKVLKRKARPNMTLNFSLNSTSASADNQENESPVLPDSRPSVFKRPTSKKMSVRFDNLSDSDTSKISNHDDSQPIVDHQSRQLRLKSARLRGKSGKNMTIDLSLDSSEANDSKNLGTLNGTEETSETDRNVADASIDSTSNVPVQINNLTFTRDAKPPGTGMTEEEPLSAPPLVPQMNLTFVTGLDNSVGLIEDACKNNRVPINDNTFVVESAAPIENASISSELDAVQSEKTRCEDEKVGTDRDDAATSETGADVGNPVRDGRIEGENPPDPVGSPRPLANQSTSSKVDDEPALVHHSNQFKRKERKINIDFTLSDTAPNESSITSPDVLKKRSGPFLKKTRNNRISITIDPDGDKTANGSAEDTLMEADEISNPGSPEIPTAPHVVSVKSPSTTTKGSPDSCMNGQSYGERPTLLISPTPSTSSKPDREPHSDQFKRPKSESPGTAPNDNATASPIDSEENSEPLLRKSSRMSNAIQPHNDEKLAGKSSNAEVGEDESGDIAVVGDNEVDPFLVPNESMLSLPMSSTHNPLKRRVGSNKISIPYTFDDTPVDTDSSNICEADDRKGSGNLCHSETSKEIEHPEGVSGDLTNNDESSFLRPSDKRANLFPRKRVRDKFSIPFKAEDSVTDGESADMNDCSLDTSKQLANQSSVASVVEGNLGGSSPHNDSPKAMDETQSSDALSLRCSLNDIPQSSVESQEDTPCTLNEKAEGEGEQLAHHSSNVNFPEEVENTIRSAPTCSRQDSTIHTEKEPSTLRRSTRGSRNVTVSSNSRDVSVGKTAYQNSTKSKSRANKSSAALDSITNDLNVSETEMEGIHESLTGAPKASSPEKVQSEPVPDKEVIETDTPDSIRDIPQNQTASHVSRESRGETSIYVSGSSGDPQFEIQHRSESTLRITDGLPRTDVPDGLARELPAASCKAEGPRAEPESNVSCELADNVDQLRSSLEPQVCTIRAPSPLPVKIMDDLNLSTDSFHRSAIVSPVIPSPDVVVLKELEPVDDNVASFLPKEQQSANAKTGRGNVSTRMIKTMQSSASSLDLHLTTLGTVAGDGTNFKSHAAASQSFVPEAAALPVTFPEPKEKPALDVVETDVEYKGCVERQSPPPTNLQGECLIGDGAIFSKFPPPGQQNTLNSGEPLSTFKAPERSTEEDDGNVAVPSSSVQNRPERDGEQLLPDNQNPTADRNDIRDEYAPPGPNFPRRSKRKSVSFKPPTENVYHSPPDFGSFQQGQQNAEGKGAEGLDNGYEEFSRIQMTVEISDIQPLSGAKKTKRHFSSTPISKPKRSSSPTESIAPPQPLTNAQPTNHEFLVPPAIPATRRVSILPVPEIITSGPVTEDGRVSSEGGSGTSSYDLSCENSLEISAIPKENAVPKINNLFHSTPIHRTRASTKRMKSNAQKPPVAPLVETKGEAGARVVNHSVQTSQRPSTSPENGNSSELTPQSTCQSIPLRRSARRNQTPIPAGLGTSKSGGDEPIDVSPVNRIAIQDNTIVSTRVDSKSRTRGSRTNTESAFKSYDSHRKMTSRRLFEENQGDDEKESSPDAGYPSGSSKTSPARSTDVPSTGRSAFQQDDGISSPPETPIPRSPALSIPRTDENVSFSAHQEDDFSEDDSVTSAASSGTSSSVPSHVVMRQTFESQLHSLISQPTRHRERARPRQSAPEPPKPRSRFAVSLPGEDLDSLYPLDQSGLSRKRKRNQPIRRAPSVKLFNPGPKWNGKSKRLYAWLKKKLRPTCGLNVNAEAERLVIELENARVLVSRGYVDGNLDPCINRLKRLNLCSTQLQLWNFFMRFMPFEFVRDVVPMGGAFGTPFDRSMSFPSDPI